MFKRLLNPTRLPGSDFLGTKLGQAAIASTCAMTAMVVMTTQVDRASAAGLVAPHADRVMVEIA